MKLPVLGMALLMVGATACVSSTEPKDPWYYGDWVAVSVADKPLPVNVSSNQFYTTRADSLSFSFNRVLHASHEHMSEVTIQSGRVSSTTCLGLLSLSVRGDTIETYFSSQLATTCGPSRFQYRLVRTGDTMTTMWLGAPVVLARR